MNEQGFFEILMGILRLRMGEFRLMTTHCVSCRVTGQFSTNQNKSHWWTNILDNTGSVTDRRSETAALLTDRRWDHKGFLSDRPADKASRDWSMKENNQVDRDLFYRPNSLWDANLGKNSDKRVHFGRGGNGIFGQPLVNELR